MPRRKSTSTHDPDRQMFSEARQIDHGEHKLRIEEIHPDQNVRTQKCRCGRQVQKLVTDVVDAVRETANMDAQYYSFQSSRMDFFPLLCVLT